MRLRNRAGFTLIEMIIVISIITMLIGGSALGYGRYQQNARDTRRQSDLEQIRSALELFRSNNINSTYPTTGSPACNWQNSLAPYFGGTVANIPQDPRGGCYTYVAAPAGCTNVSPSLCTSYALSATLELSGVCSVNPNRPATAC